MIKLDTREELGIEDSKTCESTAYIPISISTPISLKPCIKKLPITASISGDPVIEPRGCGKFILTQELCVKVPIEITIESNVGKKSSSCKKLPIGNYPQW